MITSDADSFPLINGRCAIRAATIYITSDAASARLERLFGRDPQRRSILLAVIAGLPLAGVSAFLIINGYFHAAFYPTIIAAFFLTSPVFCRGTSYPEQIPVRDIQSVVGHPPKKHRSLGHFTVHFILNGMRTQTSIALPCVDHATHLASFRDALAVFDRAGIAVITSADTAPNTTA